MFKITITQQHAKTGVYNDGECCPLFLAIKEQQPEFPIKRVLGGGEIRMTNNKICNYTPAPGPPESFSYIEAKKYLNETWNSETNRMLINGEIESFEVTVYG